MLPSALPVRSIPVPPSTKALGGASSWQVNFRVASQEQTQWCWAAVSSSVAAYFGPGSNWTQCAVASAEMGGQCCVSGSSRTCNQPHYLDRALQHVGHLRSAAQGYMPPQAVVDELKLDRPVGIRVGWRSGGGHFLAVVGLTPQGQGAILQVSDPIFGFSSVQGAALVSGGYLSAGGRWTHSYAVQP